jgi:TRAP-type C4-dicarboxylate transport system permease small subunit
MRGADIGLAMWLLFLVFVASWFGAFLAFVESDRIVWLLEVGPQRYLDYVETTAIFLAAPSIIEIAAIVIANVSSRRFWVEFLSWWPVLAGYGVLFLLFSSFGLIWAVSSYNAATKAHLQNPFFVVYASTVAGFLLWALAGFLFLVIPLRRRRRRPVRGLG